MQEDGSRRAIVAAFLANLGIAIAKFVAFLITGAASMLAESVHSLADTGNQALLILGAARAKQDATLEHPFGYGRERYFWAFVVAMVLFSFGLVASYLRQKQLLERVIKTSVALVIAASLAIWFRTTVMDSPPDLPGLLTRSLLILGFVIGTMYYYLSVVRDLETALAGGGEEPAPDLPSARLMR